MTNPVESQNPLSNEALISDKRKELDWINKKLRTPELPKEEEKKLMNFWEMKLTKIL